MNTQNSDYTALTCNIVILLKQYIYIYLCLSMSCRRNQPKRYFKLKLHCTESHNEKRTFLQISFFFSPLFSFSRFVLYLIFHFPLLEYYVMLPKESKFVGKFFVFVFVLFFFSFLSFFLLMTLVNNC